MSYPTKAVAALLAIVASVALAACGGDDDDSGNTNAATTTATTATKDSAQKKEKPQSGMQKPQSAMPMIVLLDGEPVGGVRELEYSAGEQIRFTVRSDVADEVHVHGYDLAKDVPAGGSVAFSFPADIEGIFEVELEERVEQIAELIVNP